MNIYDISKKAGVSIATVSRVINNKDRVSEKTRKKIMDVIEQEGYTPNEYARGLALQSTKVIGVLCPDSSDSYTAAAIYNVERCLRDYGYDCILCCTGHRQEDREKYMKLIDSKQIDALVLVGSSYAAQDPKDQQYIIDAAKEKPVMIINGEVDAPNVYSVACGDEAAVEAATSGLIESGSRDILFLYNARSYSGRRKLQGYKNALQKHGIRERDELIALVTGGLDETIDFLLRQRSEGLRFDAVMASDDYLAAAAVKYAKKTGLKIPEDFQVIGYNDLMLARCCEPELTTVDSRVEDLSVAAVNYLMQILDGETPRQHSLLEGRLTWRGTTRTSEDGNPAPE
jgi:LacI family transcriptional regulator